MGQPFTTEYLLKKDSIDGRCIGFFQDAVSSEQVLSDAARVHDAEATPKNNVSDRTATTNQENVGKIWNWPFETNPPAKDQLKNSPLTQPKQTVNKSADDDSDASASGYKKSFLNKVIGGKDKFPEETKSRPSIRRMNSDKKRNSAERDYDFDDSASDDYSRDASFDYSQSFGSSQSDDDDDDDDLSNDESFRFPQSSRTATTPNQKLPNSFSLGKTMPPMAAASSFVSAGKKPIQIVPSKKPIMQARSLPMYMQTRSLQMRPASRTFGRRARGGDSVGM